MSSGVSFFFLRRVALVVGVLLSSKSFTLLVGVLLASKSLLSLLGCERVFFLHRAAVHAAVGFFEGLLYLWGRLACGVAWLVERWSFVSCFFSFYK